ncbi:MAG: S1C family serine protease, partial [Trebonia sp.]
GGPLANSRAEVIGIDTAASTNYQFGGYGSPGSSGDGTATQGYAIPINTALSIAKQIESGQASSTVHIGATAFLGVEIASQQGNGQGVLIAGAQQGTPAAKAGLGRYDVITSLDGKSVAAGTDVQQILIGHHPGDKVSIAWTGPDGQSHTATLTLGTGPAA